MLNKISNTALDLYRSLPNFRLDSAENIVKKCSKLAYPIIALIAIEGLPKAISGPVAYAGCFAACVALTLGGFAPACAYACAPALAAPTP
jgi:hypothetical protein